MAAPPRGELTDFLVGAGLASLSVSDPGLNLLQMPFLDIEIRADGLFQEVTAIALEDIGEGIEGVDLVGIDAEANGLLVHMTKAYRALQRMATPHLRCRLELQHLEILVHL
jgi:hypothetical protein